LILVKDGIALLLRECLQSYRNYCGEKREQAKP
jgi:hypothetical protein